MLYCKCNLCRAGMKGTLFGYIVRPSWYNVGGDQKSVYWTLSHPQVYIHGHLTNQTASNVMPHTHLFGFPVHSPSYTVSTQSSPVDQGSSNMHMPHTLQWVLHTSMLSPLHHLFPLIIELEVRALALTGSPVQGRSQPLPPLSHHTNHWNACL